jgi:hypothetical protein
MKYNQNLNSQKSLELCVHIGLNMMVSDLVEFIQKLSSWLKIAYNCVKKLSFFSVIAI